MFFTWYVQIGLQRKYLIRTLYKIVVLWRSIAHKIKMGWKGILGFDYGIIQAPLGPSLASPQLTAAVANSGALGIISAPYWDDDPEALRQMIRTTKSLTDKPFGVGIVLASDYKNNLRVILEEKVAFLEADWGTLPQDLVDAVHAAGTKILSQVGSLEQAKDAMEAGMDAIIVQGYGAGGQVLGQESLFGLLPKVLDYVKNSRVKIPVIAAGGIVDARGYVAALAFGADGIALGTRFVASVESNAHPWYKELIVKNDNTEYVNVFGRERWPNKATRVLSLGYFYKALPPPETELDKPLLGSTTVYGRQEHIPLYSGTAPNQSNSGKIEWMALYAGEGVGLITEILPASEIIRRLVTGAQQLLPQIKSTMI